MPGSRRSGGGSAREERGATAGGATAAAGHACPRAGTGACLAPCSRELNGEYAAVVAEVRRVLAGDGETVDGRLQERQAGLVQALAFEQAARLQRQREALERALRSVRRLRAALRDEAVLVYPAKRPGWVALWGVRGGRVAIEREVGRAAFGRGAARGFLAELAAADPPRPPLPTALIDEMLLVHSWLRAHRAAPNVLDTRALVEGAQAPEEAAAPLLERVRLCVRPAAAGGAPKPAAAEPELEAAAPARFAPAPADA
jgi:excinuclease UvrABC nuclease subunit